MRKLFLVLLVVLSLNASEFTCKDSYSRYVKYSELFEFAYERSDVYQMKFSNKMSIHYIERALVDCGPDWKVREHGLTIRKSVIEISKILKKL